MIYLFAPHQFKPHFYWHGEVKRTFHAYGDDFFPVHKASGKVIDCLSLILLVSPVEFGLMANQVPTLASDIRAAAAYRTHGFENHVVIK